MVHSAAPARRSSRKRRGSKPRIRGEREHGEREHGGLAAAFASLEAVRKLATAPARLAVGSQPASTSPAGGPGLPDVQFDLSRFVRPAQPAGGSTAVVPPVYTLFAPARLGAAPSLEDQRQLTAALAWIEETYAFAPQGVFTFVAYGIPYFNRFPGWMFGTLVPRLSCDNSRFAVEEAVPAPTDVSPGRPASPGIARTRFSVPVRIEQNDLLVTLRSDSADNLRDVMAFLRGSNRLGGQDAPSPQLGCGLTFTSARLMFWQRGLPRSVADSNNLRYASHLSPRSPTWMRPADPPATACAPAPSVTFQGAGGIRLTTAESGDYFDNGSLQHLCHGILDLSQFAGRAASKMAEEDRAAAGQPVQVRMDGPGFDSLDVPDGSKQPKLELTAFAPSAGFFAPSAGFFAPSAGSYALYAAPAGSYAAERANRASPGGQQESGVAPSGHGLERFLTVTRRQNFLIPPRRHRAFPFAELRWAGRR